MDSNPFEKVRVNVDPIYKAKMNALSKVQNTYDATIGQTANQAAMAGAMAGAGNPARVSADTYAQTAENRDKAIYGVESQFGMAAAQSEVQQQFNLDMASAQWESEQAGVLDTILNVGVPALTGGVDILDAINVGAGIFGFGKKKAGTAEASRGSKNRFFNIPGELPVGGRR